jgi:hypothetical protein
MVAFALFAELLPPLLFDDLSFFESEEDFVRDSWINIVEERKEAM